MLTLQAQQALTKKPHTRTTVHNIVTVGAGAWGTALAVQLARNGVATQLWSRRPEHVDAMQQEGENSRYLAGVALPQNLLPGSDLENMIRQHRDILVAVPSSAFQATLSTIKPWLRCDARIIWATKGFESNSGAFLHEVANDVLPDVPTAVLSGPSFAAELGKGLPTAVTIASQNEDWLNDAVGFFHGGNLRVYSSEDMVGVQLGGAVKNVMAIAAGISAGMQYGSNARAAMITRGLAEIMRLGERLGAERETLMGLSGVGDLVLTCTDALSRNYRFGLAIGSGVDQSTAKAEINQVIEGAETAKVILQVAKRAEVELPICDVVYQVLCEGLAPDKAVATLLTREQRHEF